MAVRRDLGTGGNRYSSVQKCLHGVSAVFIVWLMSSGFYIALAPVSDTLRYAVGEFNVASGALFIPLFFFRIYVSFGQCCSGLVGATSPAQYLASFVHALMYVATATILISGVLMMKRDINVFYFFSIPPLLANPVLLEGFGSVHDIACVGLVLLLALHVWAVIKHQWSGQSVLKRMFC